MSFVEGLIKWTNDTFGSFGSWGLFWLAFIESSVFPIPPDLLLIALSITDPSNALFYALICTIGSVFGGIFGYCIGYVGEMAILEKLFKHEKIEKMHNYFEKYEAWAIFVAGFTPIPYKVFTIGAGVFYVNLQKFIIFSFLGRGLRFFTEAVLLMYFGDKIVKFLSSSFNLYTFVITFALIGAFFLYKKFKK